MKVSIIGTGYVGLVTGVCLASKGHSVVCVDRIEEKVDCINRAEPPIFEAGLDTLLKQEVGRRLSATTSLLHAILETDLSLIAVGTPFHGDQIDLRFIREAAKDIGEVLREKDDYHVVVVKSTVVPGTTEEVVLPLLEESSGKKAGSDFGVGMNPEFLREGEAIADCMDPDRIVLGGIDERTLEKLDELYAIFPEVDKIRTNPRSAEMIKYAANALLATLISFSNEIGNLSGAIGHVDVLEVLNGVHLDKRFSPLLPDGKRIAPAFLSYLAAGCGFGGSCFPKDLRALIRFGKDHGQSMHILDATMVTNQAQPGQMMALMQKHYPDMNGLKVAVLGLAFKPGTDDIRESASIAVIRSLLAKEAIVVAYDPVAREETEKLLGVGTITYSESLSDCIEGVDVVLLMTAWPEFRKLPEIINSKHKPPLLVDGRRMISKDSVDRYEGIGLS